MTTVREGVLPGPLRLTSGVAAPVLGVVAAVAADRLLSPPVRRRVLAGTAVYAGLGVVANGASRSPLERAVWTPVSAVGTVLAVQAWREAATDRG